MRRRVLEVGLLFTHTRTPMHIKHTVNSEVLTALCQSQHMHTHTEGMAVMKCPILLVFAPVSLIQRKPKCVFVYVKKSLHVVSVGVFSLKILFF